MEDWGLLSQESTSHILSSETKARFLAFDHHLSLDELSSWRPLLEAGTLLRDQLIELSRVCHFYCALWRFLGSNRTTDRTTRHPAGTLPWWHHLEAGKTPRTEGEQG